MEQREETGKYRDFRGRAGRQSRRSPEIMLAWRELFVIGILSGRLFKTKCHMPDLSVDKQAYIHIIAVSNFRVEKE